MSKNIWFSSDYSKIFNCNISTQHDGARSVALHAVADEEGLEHVEDGLEAVELGHLLLGLDLDLHAAGGAARAVEAAVGTEQNVGDLHRSSSRHNRYRAASFIAASLRCLLLLRYQYYAARQGELCNDGK